MADETNNAPLQETPDKEPVAPAAEPITPDSTPADSQEHMIPKSRFDEINSELKQLRKEQVKAEKAAEEAKKKQLEEQNKFKELYEAEAAKVNDYEARVKKMEYDSLRRQVATDAGFPQLWQRISGGDEDELKTDLESLLEAFPDQKPQAPSLNGGAGTGNRKPGKPAPTEAEIREQAARYGVSPQYMAEQYGVQLSTK